MKPHVIFASLLAIAATTTTLAQERPRERDATSPASRNTPPGSNRTEDTNQFSPQQFVQTAAWSGLKEVRLGELAQQRAQNTEVRAFGRQMVQDHTAANEKLASIARRLGYPLPDTNAFTVTPGNQLPVRDPQTPAERQAEQIRSEPSKGTADDIRLGRDRMPRDREMSQQHDVRTYQRLQRTPSAEFDRAYTREMIADHQHAVRQFEQASTTLTDNELKAFATETLPKLREHLHHAQKLAKDNGWPTPSDVDHNKTSETIPSRDRVRPQE
jgi:putative membrane protein